MQSFMHSNSCNSCYSYPDCIPPNPCRPRYPSDNPCYPSDNGPLRSACYPCPPPRPQVSCGSTYYPWTDCYGNCFKSKLVSETNTTLLNTTLATTAASIAALYNTGNLTVSDILGLGLFDASSTIVDVGSSITYVGAAEIASYLSATLTALRLAVGSTMTAVMTAQLLTNDLLSVTARLTIASTPNIVFTIVTLSKSVNCGAGTPVVVSGTVTHTPLP